jgi:hypothetical protein
MQIKRINLFSGIFLVILFSHCALEKPKEDAQVWNKVGIDFKSIDEQGLTGPEGGKVSVSYEFCIPRDERLWKRVTGIDRTAERSASPGRIRCTDEQWLVTGNTHQANYKRVLYELAALPEVVRIQQAFFE